MINETDPDLKQKVVRMTRAARFGFLAILLVVSYLNIRAAIVIPYYKKVFPDMLAGRPLPPLTDFVISFEVELLVISIALPLVGTVIGSLASLHKAVITLSSLTAVACIQIALMRIAFLLPFLPGPSMTALRFSLL